MSKKPLVFCGDLNVAHTAIDLANPESNYNKTAGFTQSEIDGLNHYLESGLVDSFRRFHPTEIKYSFWSYRYFARKKNIGWRIDYFLISNPLISKVKNADILTHIEGSDHCPVLLELRN